MPLGTMALAPRQGSMRWTTHSFLSLAISMAKKGMHLSNAPNVAVHCVVNCLELTRVCDIALSRDIYRLFPPSKTDNQIVRQYNEEFCKTGQVVVPFQNTEGARTGLFHSAGRSIGTKPVTVNLVSQGTLNEYRHVNTMVENPENCLRYFAFPPGTSMEDVLRVFKDFKLKQSTLGSPIAFSPSKRCALVEFESKDEAHRAFRKLVGKEIVSSMGNWTLCLELML